MMQVVCILLKKREIFITKKGRLGCLTDKSPVQTSLLGPIMPRRRLHIPFIIPFVKKNGELLRYKTNFQEDAFLITSILNIIKENIDYLMIESLSNNLRIQLSRI